MNITISKIYGNELHRHYAGQSAAQPCYIELDCRTGDLSASYNAEIGNAIPFSVFHGHTRRWSIPCLTDAAANDLMAELAPLAGRVCDGYTSVYDGCNSAASFSDDATTAIEEIDRICYELESDESNSVTEWDAGDWLDSSTGCSDECGKQCHFSEMHHAVIDGVNAEYTIDAQTTDDRLASIEAAIEADLDKNMVLVGLSKYLENIRQVCSNNAE